MTENYKNIEIIGQGMYGKVYKSLNINENKYYAIKSLNFKDISSKERLNIEREVNLLKELKHPNIVLYKDSFISKDNYFDIVTTFCEGGDMYKKIFKENNIYFEENKIINWIVQLLLGLSYIHDKKIVHRDIKTKNIFIQNENVLRIGDFGIAKFFGQTQTTNKIVGTPLYMAPECFKQNNKYSFKSDIWSLGCCIYEMCNLKHAFEGKFFPAVSVKISEGKRAPLNKKYSEDLKNLVDSMLDLNYNKRPNISKILKMPFIREKVGEYIKDFCYNYKKYDGTQEQIDILKEQAEKFLIFKDKLNKNINEDIYIYNKDKNTINNNKYLIDKKNKNNMNNIYTVNNYKNIDNKLKEGKKSYLLDKKEKRNKNSFSKKDILERDSNIFGYSRLSIQNEDKKRMKFKQNLSPSQYFDFKDNKYLNLIYGKNKDNSKNDIKNINENSKSKKEIDKKEPNKKAIKENNYFKDKKNQKLLLINNDFVFPERKTDYSDAYHKKFMSKQQSTNNYNIEYEYNENQNNNNNNILKKFKNKVIYINNFMDNQDKSKIGRNTSDGFYNDNNDLNIVNNYNYLKENLKQNNSNKTLNKQVINDKNRILNKRIDFFKERCLKSLGENFYNKAYNYLKEARKNNFPNNDKIREYLSNNFGKNNIGYWQLIDQILLLEDILETN